MPYALTGMANAEIRSHDEYLSPASLNLRRGTTELQLQQTQPTSQASGARKMMIDDMLWQNWSTLHSALIDLSRKQAVTESSPRMSQFSRLASEFCAAL
jgi:hypothetical protein